MRNKLIISIAGWVALAVTGFVVADTAAAAESTKGDDCVAFSSLHDSKKYPGYYWQVLDNNNFVILVHQNNRLYHIRVGISLPDLPVARQLEFQENGARLCDMPPSSVVLVGRNMPNVSQITSMKRLDAEGIAALEKQYNTKIEPKKKA